MLIIFSLLYASFLLSIMRHNQELMIRIFKLRPNRVLNKPPSLGKKKIRTFSKQEFISLASDLFKGIKGILFLPTGCRSGRWCVVNIKILSVDRFYPVVLDDSKENPGSLHPPLQGPGSSWTFSYHDLPSLCPASKDPLLKNNGLNQCFSISAYTKLVKTQISGFYPHSCRFTRSGVKPENLHF